MHPSFAITAEAALHYWEHLDSPTSLGLAIAARSGDWSVALTHKVVPENFLDPSEYARAAFAVAFLKKNPDVPGSSSEVRRAAAVQSWRDGEASCFWANERLSSFVIGPLQDTIPAKFLRRVRARLLDWLGRAPGDTELLASCRHGPGTTFSSSVRYPTAADKYQEVPTVTSNALSYFYGVSGSLWGDIISKDPGVRGRISVTKGNRFVSVPKTALTDRGIAIESSLNVYFQLSVGSAIRRRLKTRTGWDLNVAAPIHRKMAQLGSLDGSFATIDLSNASDSLCKNLVKVLLSDSPWLKVLEDLRSSHTQIDGRWHLLEKFSSMGNGYTFELETAIFAAIASVCLELKGHTGLLGYDLFVFGDDILVPNDCYQIVVDSLKWLGFSANLSKSYHTGSFRESCGGDYFAGVPVRGFYLKGKLISDSERIFTVINGVRACLDHSGLPGLGFRLGFFLSHLSPRFRDIGGSVRLGDSVIHGLPPVYRWKDGIRWVKAVEWNKPSVVNWGVFSDTTRLACRLTGYGDTFGISSRGKFPSGKVVWVSDS